MCGCSSSTTADTTSSSEAIETTDATEADASEEATVSTDTDDTALKIGFSIICTDGYYVVGLINRYEELIEEYGYDSVILDCQFDTATQVTQIDNLIAQDVDVIIVMPIDSLALITEIQKANEAGIPVFCVHSKIDESGEDYIIGFAGSDSVKLGEGAGSLMEEALGGEGNVVIMGGSPGSDNANCLTEGFMSQLSSDITILTTVDTNWDRSTTTTLMEDLLTQYGDDIDGVWAMDDNIAIGAINAIEAAGYTAGQDMVVVGINGQSEAWDYIKSGALYGTVIQDPAANIELTFDIIQQYLNGEEVEKYNYTGSPTVTIDNVNETDPAF
ncbi:MAG: sugar ABC transporter substrate-binding protein [Eubacteriales bacterium]|nr:sugar ABC transporter substrate-binding protein [Eubacteriales bacterium]